MCSKKSVFEHNLIHRVNNLHLGGVKCAQKGHIIYENDNKNEGLP